MVKNITLLLLFFCFCSAARGADLNDFTLRGTATSVTIYSLSNSSIVRIIVGFRVGTPSITDLVAECVPSIFSDCSEFDHSSGRPVWLAPCDDVVALVGQGSDGEIINAFICTEGSGACIQGDGFMSADADTGGAVLQAKAISESVFCSK